MSLWVRVSTPPSFAFAWAALNLASDFCSTVLEAPPETIKLPSGRSLAVAKFCCVFRKWQGTPIADTYGGKAVLDCEGDPVFAELASWLDGVWNDRYRGKYRTGLPGLTEPVQLLEEQARLLERISGTRLRGGCFDVIVWKEHQTRFLELKRRKRDKIRDTQAAWLEAALAEGLSVNDFAIVEWDFVS
jgi:hypothetical protein